MKCPEVEELMQRHLDSDLDEQEESQLLDHIRNCSDCATMYEKLIQLSEDLTKLPAVSPPVSIVDSIMPRLDELQLPASNRHKPSVQSLASSAQTAAPIRSRQQAAKSPTTRKSNKTYLWSALSGVAAVGLAIGVFIFTMDGPGNRHAELRAPQTTSSESSDSAPSSYNLMENSKEAGTTSDQSGSAGDSLGAAAEDSSVVGKSARDGESSSNDRSLSGNRGHAEEESAETQEGLGQESFNNEPQVGSMMDEPDASEEMEPSQAPDSVPDPAQEEQPSAAVESPDKDTPISNRESPPATEEPESSPSPPEQERMGMTDGDQEKPEADKTPSDTGDVPPRIDPEFREPSVLYERLLSPGDDLFAYVTEQRVMISASNGEIRYASVHKWKPEDTVRFVTWLSEQEVLYQVDSASGETVQYYVNIERETEMEIAQ